MLMPYVKKLRAHFACELCGASLDGMRPHAKFCSRSCKSKSTQKERDARSYSKWNEWYREYRQTPARKEYMRRYRYRWTYGISREEAEERIAAQGGVCAICLGPPPTRKLLALDHDHQTGALREFLCDSCNWMIGLAKDTPETLRAAALYLEKHRAVV